MPDLGGRCQRCEKHDEECVIPSQDRAARFDDLDEAPQVGVPARSLTERLAVS